jgi:hypothetical protein
MSDDLERRIEEITRDPSIQELSRSNRHDAATGKTTGQGRYLVYLPNLQRSVGLEITVVASHTARTTFHARCTQPELDVEIVFRQLFGDK